MLLHWQLGHSNVHLGKIGSRPFIQTSHAHLGLGTHIPRIMIEAHTRCTAILMQHLFAEATAGSIILGDDLKRRCKQ